MPIRYEAPAPLDAGLLDAISRRRGDDRAAADYRAQLAAQADFARTAVAAGAQRADAGNMQFLAELSRDRLQEQQRQFDIGEANQFHLIDRRAAAQNWLNQQDMSYAEQIRLQRLQSEVGAIEADDTLARFEKDQLILQKRTGIDLGRKRLEETMARQREAQANEDLENAQRMNRLGRMQEEFAAMPLEKRLQPVAPEMGGGFMYMDSVGQWKYQPPPKPAEEPKIDWKAIEQEARMAVPPDVVDPTTGKETYSSAKRVAQFHDYQRKILERERRRQGGGPPEQAEPAGQSDELRPPPPVRPFRLDAKEGLTAGQQAMAEGYFDTARMIDRLPDSNPRKKEARQAHRIAGEIVEGLGRAPVPGERDYENYQLLSRVVYETLAAGG